MSEQQHTPGPWINRDCSIRGEKGFAYLAYVSHQSTSPATSIANANLIAAAPELKAALEDVLERTKNIGMSKFPSRAHYDAFVDACFNADVALEKAKGGGA